MQEYIYLSQAFIYRLILFASFFVSLLSVLFSLSLSAYKFFLFFIKEKPLKGKGALFVGGVLYSFTTVWAVDNNDLSNKENFYKNQAGKYFNRCDLLLKEETLKKYFRIIPKLNQQNIEKEKSHKNEEILKFSEALKFSEVFSKFNASTLTGGALSSFFKMPFCHPEETFQENILSETLFCFPSNKYEELKIAFLIYKNQYRFLERASLRDIKNGLNEVIKKDNNIKGQDIMPFDTLCSLFWEFSHQFKENYEALKYVYDIAENEGKISFTEIKDALNPQHEKLQAIQAILRNLDPSYKAGNCENNALAAKLLIEKINSTSSFDDLSVGEKIELALRRIFYNIPCCDSFDICYREVSKEKIPKKVLTLLRHMLAYKTIKHFEKYEELFLNSHHNPSFLVSVTPQGFPIHSGFAALWAALHTDNMVLFLNHKQMKVGKKEERFYLEGQSHDLLVFQNQKGKMKFISSVDALDEEFSKVGIGIDSYAVQSTDLKPFELKK